MIEVAIHMCTVVVGSDYIASTDNHSLFGRSKESSLVALYVHTLARFTERVSVEASLEDRPFTVSRNHSPNHGS